MTDDTPVARMTIQQIRSELRKWQALALAGVARTDAERDRVARLWQAVDDECRREQRMRQANLCTDEPKGEPYKPPEYFCVGARGASRGLGDQRIGYDRMTAFIQNTGDKSTEATCVAGGLADHIGRNVPAPSVRVLDAMPAAAGAVQACRMRAFGAADNDAIVAAMIAWPLELDGQANQCRRG
jgi:hypothetical protein